MQLYLLTLPEPPMSQMPWLQLLNWLQRMPLQDVVVGSDPSPYTKAQDQRVKESLVPF
jgi:hypothetical protein